MTLLSRISRRVLIREADSSAGARAPDSHAASGLITSTSDASYKDAITRFPQVKAHLDDMISTFESAKAERIAYIRDKFSKRMRELRLTLYGREAGDKQKYAQTAQVSERDTKLQQAILRRISQTKIAIPAYPQSFERTGVFENIAAWARISESYSVSRGSRGSMLGFAPIEVPFVFVRSPSLTFAASGGVTGASVDPNILSVIKHELIHQEDHAASSFVLGKTNPAPAETEAADSTRTELPTALSLALLESALLPPSAVTESMVREVVMMSSRLREMIKDTRNIPTLITQISDMLMRLLCKGYLYRLGQKSDRREASHARVYLTLIRPDLEAAARGYISADASDAENRAAVIDRVLNRADVGALSVQLMSIVSLLMVLDMGRIRDLLLVAKNDQSTIDREQSRSA